MKNGRSIAIGLAGTLVLAGLGAWLSLRPKAPPSLPSLPGQVVPDFTLLDHEGRAQALHREAGARAVVIIGQGNDCPIIQKYAIRIRELKAKFAELGVPIFLINANPQDSRADIIREAKEYGFGVPILLDPSQVVARALGIDRTGQAVIIDPSTWKVIYSGAIDDRLSYGADKQEPRHNYLEDALDELLAGKPYSKAPPPAKGCAISFREENGITYSDHVAPVLRDKCLNCHSPKGFYPPFFDSYETVKGWTAMIRETILTERMPPWSSDPHYGKYSNDISLSAEQKHAIVSWINSGAPRGGGADPLVGAEPSVSRRKLPPKLWEVGLKAPNKVDPRGTIEYQFYQVGGPAPYDMWVTAYKTTSSNPVQLHHESMMITSKPLSFYESQVEKVRDPGLVAGHPDGDVPLWTMEIMKKNELNRDDNYVRFSVWAAGRPQPTFLPKGTGIFIPKGYYAILEVHYVGNGKEDQEQTKVEFFGERSRGNLKQLRTMQVVTTDIEVPPGVKSLEVETRVFTVKRDMMVTGFLSHMHMRGRSVRLLQLPEEGRKGRVLASIPNFDFNWQSGFPLSPVEPILLKKGARIKAVCEFDNSPFNPLNPDATREVRHGQTLDRAEMCKFMLAYYYPN